MYTEIYAVYDKYIHGLKIDILGQINHLSESLWPDQQTDEEAGVCLTRYWVSLHIIHLSYFLKKLVWNLYWISPFPSAKWIINSCVDSW